MISDTTAEAAAFQTEVHRRIGASGRFRVAVEMSELARNLAVAGLRARRPALNEIELRRELLSGLTRRRERFNSG
jgi:hypothetical protein